MTVLPYNPETCYPMPFQALNQSCKGQPILTLFSLVMVAMVGYSKPSLLSIVHAYVFLSMLNVLMLLRAMDTVMVNKSCHMPTLWENPTKVA